MARTLTSLPAYIGFGSSLSTSVDAGSDYVVGLVMPEVWTPAQVTVQVSTDGAQFHDLFDYDVETATSGKELAFNVTPGAMVAINPNTLLMARYIKLRSGTRNEPVDQAETCMFSVITTDVVGGGGAAPKEA